MLRNGNSPLKSTFHYSIIPLFHVRGKNIGPQKIFPLISASCTNSETLNEGEIIESGTPEKITASEVVRSVYLGEGFNL